MDVNGIQTPVAISTCNGILKQNYKLFLIDHVLLQSTPEVAVNKLWKDYFDYI